MRTVYNTIDFSYRPSVGKNSIEKSKMTDNVLVAMGSSDIGYVLNVKETETTFVTPVNLTFTRKRFHNEVKSIFFIDLNNDITSCLP